MKKIYKILKKNIYKIIKNKILNKSIIKITILT